MDIRVYSWLNFIAMTDIAENIAAIRAQIKKIAAANGYAKDRSHLIAVSKMQPDARIDAALAAGHRIYGENRVQEAYERWQARREHYPDLKLHLIGPLQTNKVRDAVALFDAIHTIDRDKLAQALASEMQKQGRELECLVQVNTGEEDQKAGVAPGDLPALLAACEEYGLKIAGLMCIPPADEPAALHFAFLKKLAARHGLEKLSMGMSADYEQAAALGADYIRVGSAVFGARD
jgi:pyridoxal phosphate enzyme (YggS family)